MYQDRAERQEKIVSKNFLKGCDAIFRLKTSEIGRIVVPSPPRNLAWPLMNASALLLGIVIAKDGIPRFSLNL